MEVDDFLEFFMALRLRVFFVKDLLVRVDILPIMCLEYYPLVLIISFTTGAHAGTCSWKSGVQPLCILSQDSTSTCSMLDWLA
jgi:hypothetical protein